VDRFSRRILTGLLAVVPLLITVWIMHFVLDVVLRLGRPIVRAMAATIRPTSNEVASLLLQPWFQSFLAVLIVIVVLYAIGAATHVVLGRRILRSFDRLMTNVPLARTIYGGSRRLIQSFTARPRHGGRRVVLIAFPQPEMRAVGFVTATFRTSDSGEEVAAVYVPTTPNPTSGYVEIVPTSRLVWLDWSTNDAMSFIVSGGATAPREIPFNPRLPKQG
jgi:uncharacterized membrane protein